MKSDYGTEDNTNLKFIIALARGTQVIGREIVPDFAEAGLTESQFGVLEALYHKGPLTVNQVIEKTLSSSGNIGVVVENLKKMGLINKEVSPKDKRSRILTITVRGNKLMKDLFPRHIARLRKTLEPLNQKEKQNVITILRKLSQSKGASK